MTLTLTSHNIQEHDKLAWMPMRKSGLCGIYVGVNMELSNNDEYCYTQKMLKNAFLWVASHL